MNAQTDLWPSRCSPLVRHLAHSPLPAVLVAVGLFFSRLSCPLLEPEETRYAEIPRQMLAEGRFLEPVWHGEPYYHKPPLLYWLVMGSYTLFGVHDWAARLVPALSALGVVLITYYWGRRVAGGRAGFLAALILCLTPRYVYLARMLTLDGLLALWVVAALACAHLAMRQRFLRGGYWVLSALVCGLGVMTKGPVALVLVAVPIVLLPLLDRRAARPSWRSWAIYAAVLFAVAGPWHIATLLRHPDALGAFFWQHNVERYVAPFDHAEPIWFYLPSLLVGTLPWSLLWVPLLSGLVRRDEPARRRRALTFFLVAFLWPVVFFSLSGCKRAVYILPALPPLALVLGCYLSRRVDWQALAERDRLAHAAILTVLLAAIGASITATATQLFSPLEGSVIVVICAAVLAGYLRFGGRLAARGQWGLCCLLTFACLLVAVHQIVPGYHRKFALRGVVRDQASLANDTPVCSYPKRWDSVSYYLQRTDVRVFSTERRDGLIDEVKKHERVLLFVKSPHYLAELRSKLPEEIEFVPHGRASPHVTAGIMRVREPGGH